MNTDRDATETEFARRLRTELRTIVAERAVEAGGAGRTEAAHPRAVDAWRRRGPRIAVAGASLIAVVVAVLIASAGGGGTSAAWAVRPGAGGRVSVVIRDLDDAKGLEGALREAGLPITVTYRSRANIVACHRTAGGVPAGVGISREMKVPIRFSIDPEALAPDHQLHLTAIPDLVLITFTLRPGYADADAIETTPSALFSCKAHAPGEAPASPKGGSGRSG